MALIVADINGLGLINDLYGLEEGDRLLKHAAGLLIENCGPGAVVTRIGVGDFVIHLPGTDARSAEIIMEKIKEKVANNDDPLMRAGMAFGLAVREKDSQSLNSILRAAENYMHRQKLLIKESHRHTVLNTMLITLQANSMETATHAKRLEEHSTALGRVLGLSGGELDELALLAMLHDIGKVVIQAGIINKPDGLSPPEWIQIKRHPEIGYRITNSIPGLSHVARCILHHHERWDGSGYPCGLKGGDPFDVRILAWLMPLMP